MRMSTQQLIERHLNYLVDAIGAAVDAGDAHVEDVQVAAELAHAFVIGLLLRAKIYNDLKILRRLEEGVFALIGAPLKPAASGRSRSR